MRPRVMVETFFSELRFNVNTIEGYGYRHEEDGTGVVRVTGAGTEAVDETVRAEIIDTVRKFVQREVIPVASDLEHADAYPEEIVATMRELGLFGITIPEAYGGLGLDLLTYVGVIEELSYGWMSLTGIVNTHTMAATLIMTHGSEEQQRRWLPTMATGERRGCLSLSEPDAGSDTRNLSCRAVRDGEEYVIKLGYRGVETVEMAYSDHRVPVVNLVGEAGRGLPQILGVLEIGRINIAARAVGVARAAFDAALD